MQEVHKDILLATTFAGRVTLVVGSFVGPNLSVSTVVSMSSSIVAQEWRGVKVPRHSICPWKAAKVKIRPPSGPE